MKNYTWSFYPYHLMPLVSIFCLYLPMSGNYWYNRLTVHAELFPMTFIDWYFLIVFNLFFLGGNAFFIYWSGKKENK